MGSGARIPRTAIALIILLAVCLGGCAVVSPAAPTSAAPTNTRAASKSPTAASKARATRTPRIATPAPQRDNTPAVAPGGLLIATPRPGDAFPTIKRNRLPPEAMTTLDLLAHNGPFPYRQDGVVFQNREGLLPTKANGYYHEYTVKTPGSADRGARRIIRGAPGELYYTDDHYATFERIVP
jgi:ribonuclease T1